jgi:hypothetical protein
MLYSRVFSWLFSQIHRLGFKGLIGENPLAYFLGESVGKEKSFMMPTPDRRTSANTSRHLGHPDPEADRPRNDLAWSSFSG